MSFLHGMRFFFALFLAASGVSSLCPIFAAEPAGPVPMDLATCYALALKRSETLQIQQEEIQIAEARYWQTLSAILPQIHMEASQALSNRAVTGYRKDRFQGGVTLSQIIFNGFRDVSLSAAQKHERDARRHELVRARQLLYEDLARLFYQALNWESDLEILGRQRDALKDRVSELEERVRLGRSRKGDLLFAQTELSDNRVQIEQLTGLRGAAIELVAYLTGVESVRIRLVDQEPFPGPQQLETYLVRTGARPDVQAARDREKGAGSTVAARASELGPTALLNGNYEAVADPGEGGEWNIILSVSLPLFDGGLAASRVAEAGAARRAAKLDLSRAMRLADSDVRTAYISFVSAANQYIELQNTERSAAENYKVQKQDYELGRASNLDVLTALVRWTEVQRRLAGAEKQAKAALVALATAAGEAPRP